MSVASSTTQSTRPRVLQVITHLALGGAERVAFNLIRGLRDRFDFAVYAANGVDAGEVGQSMKRELEEMSVPLYVGTGVPIKRGGMLLAGWWGARAVKSYRPDIIHLHTEIPESSYAAMVSIKPKLAGIPLVRTIHNAVYWDPWRKLGRFCDSKMPRSFVACVAQGAKDAFEQLRSESGAGPVPQPPVIIFNGVHVTAEPRPLSSVPQGKIRILFAGRFEEQKGADLLPQIIGAVKPPLPCELMIHGSGTHEPRLRELAANPPAGWTIKIDGPVPDLSSRMPQYDLLIMPSRYEGLALLAIEAALLNVPVIATDGPGIREGFPGDYPYLAKAGDADGFARLLQQALDNPATLPAAVTSANAFAKQHFDLAAMCDAYADLYAQAMA